MPDLSNSSHYFRNLLYPHRVLFLFPDVIKILAEVFEKEEAKEPFIFVKGENDELVEVKNVSNILKCREVCKTWAESIDQFIEDTTQPSFFNAELPSPSTHALARAKCTYFGEGSWKLNEFMAHFEQTHSQSPLRNPFVGRLVVIHLPGNPNPFIPDDDPLQNQRKNQVTTLLRHYGQHIDTLNIDLPYNSNEVQNNLWLFECLSLTPNLINLKVCSLVPQTDIQFGERIQHPIAGFALPFELEEFGRMLDLINANFDEFDNENPGYVEQVELVDHVNIEASPLPYLKCLKLCDLSFLSFNQLIEAYRHVIEWLHIKPAYHLVSPNYLKWRQMEFPNLNTAYIPLNSAADARQLCWANLTRVHLEYFWHAKFYGWGKLFKRIQASWGDTLIELKLRLPKPSNSKEREKVMKDAVDCRLTLPKLKRLKIWMWSTVEFDVPLTFLEEVLKLPGLEFKRFNCDDDREVMI